MIAAAGTNDVAALQRVVGVSFPICNRLFESPLSTAAKNCKLDAFVYLWGYIWKDTDSTSCLLFMRTVAQAYIAACSVNNVDVVNFIIQQNHFEGKSLCHNLIHYRYGIIPAVRGHHVELVLSLLKRIENMDFNPEDKRTIRRKTYLKAASCGCNELLIRMLDAKMVDLHGRFKQSPRAALARAASLGHIRTVGLLLDRGWKSSDQDFKSSLYWTAINGHENVTKLLLEKKAAINEAALSRNSMVLDYSTPIAAAAGNNEIHMVQFLLDNGAESRYDALRLASSKGYELVVELLMKAGLDPNYSSIDIGQSPFDAAVEAGQD